MASELVINLSAEFQGYKYLIKFQNNEDLEVVTEELLPVENKLHYTITNPLTANVGTLKIELNAFDLDTGLSMKTATTRLRVLETLGETDAIIMPETYVPWYVQAVEQASISTNAAEQVNQRLDSLTITTWQSLLNL